jgi:hypothetical protein
MLSATNRSANASSILSGGHAEQYFTKRQSAAAPQPFDKEAAQVRESVVGTGQLVPVREVTPLDSPHTARPLALQNGTEKTVESTKDAKSEQKAKSQPESELHAASSPAMSRSTRPVKTPAPSYRRGKARMASRPGGNSSHPAVSQRVPATASTRRMKSLAAGSPGAAAHAAQNYIDSANRQMDKGNYTAAIANYKRALQADGNSSAAKARLDRARRAMQAEHEITASRR